MTKSNPDLALLLHADTPLDRFRREGGGKALNMARMSSAGFPVPAWFCVGDEAFQAFLSAHGLAERLPESHEEKERLFLSLEIPAELRAEIQCALTKMNLADRFVAVRSSGIDEDSKDHSFAGMFSSYLFQKGLEAVLDSLRRCWASAYSDRALSYRRENGLAVTGIRMGVVVQLMVDSEAAGVCFSRNPVSPLDRDHLVVDGVWGQGEGLVSGALDADHFVVNRSSFEITKRQVVKKEAEFRQSPEGGLRQVPVAEPRASAAALSDAQIAEISRLALRLEERFGGPQDMEWSLAEGKIYCLQTRPITQVPPAAFYDPHVNGTAPTLWDNSNIIESFSGVTTPLTFSFASWTYREVYLQFCDVMGVPKPVVRAHEYHFRNMLGLVRGRVYYNLLSWYRLLLLMPGASTNPGFMETMMGVKQNLKPEHGSLFDFMSQAPKYSFGVKARLMGAGFYWYWNIDRIVNDFHRDFDAIYQRSRRRDLGKLALPELADYYRELQEELLQRWQVPLINDFLCMVFFGTLKSLTGKWVAEGDAGASLQNDLLCGQGDLESTEPTKALMRIADAIDNGPAARREWYLALDPAKAWDAIRESKEHAELHARFADFLDKYGFRCVNELKLEEPDLHDDPSFALNVVANYVRMKSYSIQAMKEREEAIRDAAEKKVRGKLGALRRLVYFWVLGNARRAVRHRENLRFARTKVYGLLRNLFRAAGEKLARSGAIEAPRDIFYMTVDEWVGYVEGRAVLSDFRPVVAARFREFEVYRRTPSPPERLLTYGAAGNSIRHANVLMDGDLLKSEPLVSDDPNVLLGTPCCPGVIEGVVRVAHELRDTVGLAGEILVTSRTDPGWVPLYPACGGLLIERGSLLSHSAVVARELGLPTIVGISGGLMTRLKTGMRVRVDAGKGEVRILE